MGIVNDELTTLEWVDDSETLKVLLVELVGTGIHCTRHEGVVEHNVRFPVLCSWYSSRLGGRRLLVPHKAWGSEPGGEF